MWRREKLFLPPMFELRVVQLVASRYVYYVVLTPDIKSVYRKR
jgi:hypothetical protein